MPNIILISGDPKTKEEIKPLLPAGAGLEAFAALEEYPHPQTPQAEGKHADLLVLMDLSGEIPPAARLNPFRLAGIPLVALISSPARRDAVFRAGFDDYLLRPYVSAELKNRLERLSQVGGIPSAALERERQAAVGRLTSYFCHAVNNAMQTIRGAIDLAREEPEVSPGVDEYLAICRKETELIGIKIDRLRQIYRPKPSPPEAIPLETLVRESLKMAADDLLRNNVSVKEQIGASLPDIHGMPDRISMAFLMILFYLSEALGTRGGGELRVQAARERGSVQVILMAVPGPDPRVAGASGTLPPGLEPAADLIRSERGRLAVRPAGDGYGLHIRFPAGGEPTDR
jgi:CheY-like chemotaxis protein